MSPPRPIDVKKLMANLVFLGLSRGNKPSNDRESNLECDGWEKGSRRGGMEAGRRTRGGSRGKIQTQEYVHESWCSAVVVMLPW